jgi:hypothetical protein
MQIVSDLYVLQKMSVCLMLKDEDVLLSLSLLVVGLNRTLVVYFDDDIQFTLLSTHRLVV